MYKREIMAQLRGWAGRKKRKPLVLRGARQVGKTTLVEEFGKEFDSFISLNLEKDDAEVSAGSRPLPKCGSTCVSSITSPRTVTRGPCRSIMSVSWTGFLMKPLSLSVMAASSTRT